LYKKVIDLLKKPLKIQEDSLVANKPITIDLSYLKQRTKANPELMMEMIALYLDQTPPLIHKMNESLLGKDWDALNSAAHKLIPSFSIMGIHKDYEEMARKIQEYARFQKSLGKLPGLVKQLETVCSQACLELKEANKLIKGNKK
jgi:HPt (histidine-containing phosphotransfer) domain-containing protein